MITTPALAALLTPATTLPLHKMTSSVVQPSHSPCHFHHAHAHHSPCAHRSFSVPSTPMYHPHPQYPSNVAFHLPPPLLHSASSSSSSAFPQSINTSPSSSTRPPVQVGSCSRSRPKPFKKLSSSTNPQKHKTVQMSLEVKVEKAKGFREAFFVPLARNLPPAPPSSPVLGHSTIQRTVSPMNTSQHASDHFGSSWDNQQKAQCREHWVEHVPGSQSQRQGGMDLD